MEPRSVAGASYDAALDRFDQGMIEALETSISPVQTLRTILRGALPRERRDPRRKDEE